MKEYYFLTFFIIGFIISIFMLGWYAKDYMDYKDYKRELNGFYMRSSNITRVREYQDFRDPRGDWVAVNIRGMSYETALKTCSHEVGHEIFAEVCEQDINKCMEVLENGERQK